MAWCGVKRILIDWDEPTDAGNGHYQRYLYRLRHFQAMLGPEVVEIARPDRLAGCRIGHDGRATLNVATRTDTTEVPSRPGSEADLEKRLAGANPRERALLMAGLGLVRLDRQMPVGVFDGPPSRTSAIFTGGKSAIDLLGLGGDGALWLLELKTAQNIKVGALSELFFYSMVLHDTRHGRIVFHHRPAGPRSTITPADIAAAPRLHARVLAEASHPLLTPAVYDILTRAASARGWEVDYGFHELGGYLDQTPRSPPPPGVTTACAFLAPRAGEVTGAIPPAGTPDGAGRGRGDHGWEAGGGGDAAGFVVQTCACRLARSARRG
jgi:hypothetical protein